MNSSAIDALQTPRSRRTFLTAGALGGVTALLASCGLVSATKPQKRTGSLYLTIATPAMLGNDDLPAYIPAYPLVPANATVRVEIANFDDATPLTGALEQFAKVQGTVGGTISVEPLDAKDPNRAGTAQVVSALDPQNVSHTFTIAKLGINVPVAPKARTVFTVETGAPGTFAWRCNDPCGSGPDGWGGAMAQNGFMIGTLTIE